MTEQQNFDENSEERTPRTYTQEEVNDLLRRAVVVNIDQSNSNPPPKSEDLDPDDYPGIGAPLHIVHGVLTLLTSGLWAVVWIIHVVAARSKWDKKIRQQYARKRQENKKRQAEAEAEE